MKNASVRIIAAMLCIALLGTAFPSCKKDPNKLLGTKWQSESILADGETIPCTDYTLTIDKKGQVTYSGPGKSGTGKLNEEQTQLTIDGKTASVSMVGDKLHLSADGDTVVFKKI